jgi:hypothetical protein
MTLLPVVAVAAGILDVKKKTAHHQAQRTRGAELMQIRELYHGTNGDNILQIIRSSVILPNQEGKVFFSEWRFDSVLMHGADTRRGATFAVKLLVTIPTTAVLQQAATAGVSDTLIVATTMPLQVQVLELYVREPRANIVKTIRGIRDITKYLSV